jgi:hypothetical protein
MKDQRLISFRSAFSQRQNQRGIGWFEWMSVRKKWILKMNESVNYEIIRRIKLSEVKTATTSGDIGVDKKYRKDMIEK